MNIPQSLKDRPQWLVWRFITKPGQKKPAKMPYYVNGNLRGWPLGKPRDGVANDNQPQVEQGHELDRQHLVDFETAAASAERGEFDGVGFAFLPGDGLIGIDLDAVCADKHAAIRDACGTFTEASPSGTGIHIIGLGECETFKSNDVGVEVFCGRQFFTVTGRHDPASPLDLRPIPAGTLDKLRRTVEKAKEAARAAKHGDQPAAAPVAPTVAHNADASRYCLAALESSVQRLRSATEGGRNDLLNGEAYGLAQLIHTGGISEATIRAALQDAAQACGLPPGEAKATISSGIRAGLQNPRPLPQREQPQRRQPTPPPAPSIDPDTGEILEVANDNAPSTDLATIDWWSPFPDVTGKGKPIGTIENVYEACRRLRITVRYNVIKKDLEILIPGEAFSVDNRANASLAWVASACNRFGIPGGQLGDFLNYLGDKNLYNPVANWITCKPWDGVSRLNALYNTIKAEGEEDDVRVWDLKAAMMRRWLISAVAAAFNPNGVSAHGVLVLQGDQYLGKTKWFKSLVPAELGVIADGLMLRTDDKDSVKTAVSHWLVELGELDATFRKSDIAALKAFLTKDRDVLRRPYAKLESEFARRTVFFASVNPRQFLHDPTGNRRYWTISAVEINHDHGIDMQQLWAEVYEQHYKKGETWYLAPEEMAALNDHNRDHEVLDPIRERLLTRLDWKSDSRTDEWRWMTATDIMLEIGFDRPTRADVTHCGQIVQELNGGRRKKSNGKALSYVPPKTKV